MAIHRSKRGLTSEDELALIAWGTEGGFVPPEGGGEANPVNGAGSA